MAAHDETSNACTAELNDPADPVDIALAIALEDARDDRVCELIREAQQYREATPACGGDD